MLFVYASTGSAAGFCEIDIENQNIVQSLDWTKQTLKVEQVAQRSEQRKKAGLESEKNKSITEKIKGPLSLPAGRFFLIKRF